MRLDDEPSWRLREQRLIRGQAQLGLVCGLQYVRSQERGDEPGMELLAAPVMLGRRYGLEPVYFSDVVVRVGHAARTFDDLSGTAFAFNERTSHSGYGVVRHALAERGFATGFFHSIVESGAHQRSLSLITSGEVDGSAIDSTVLETEFRRMPNLQREVKVVSTLGPSPIPPPGRLTCTAISATPRFTAGRARHAP
jgi:phosphonate transport system substrate-binding protein